MKKLALIALAAVSMSAFAQDTNKSWSTDSNMMSGIWLDKPIADQSMSDVKKAVWEHASMYMLAGDAAVLKDIHQREAGNVNMALTNALAGVLQQSMILESGYNNFETSDTGKQLKAIIGQNKALGPDTWAILDNPMPMASDSQGRAQRFVTWDGAPSVGTNYVEILRALNGSLNRTQAAVLTDWFWNTSEANRDAVSKFVQSAVNVHALNYKSALRGNYDW